MFDGSRQSDIFTANVSGIGPAARIAISDVALDRASLDEVKVVTAHEAGHYVLGHVWRHILVLPLLAFFVLALQLGRASCRERVCQYVYISVVAGSLQNKNKPTIV